MADEAESLKRELYARNARNVHRTELFSDAVLAIALTLLVLNLNELAYSDKELTGRLIRQWPAYMAFMASFLYIGIMWVNHHEIFEKLGATDKPLLWANLGILWGAIIMPFPTAVLAEAFQLGSQAHEQTAVMLYAGLMTVMGLSWALLFHVICRRPNLWQNSGDGPMWRSMRIRSMPAALGYVVAGLLGLLISPQLALVLFAVIPIFYVLA